jgi:hypothetical protein
MRSKAAMTPQVYVAPNQGETWKKQTREIIKSLESSKAAGSGVLCVLTSNDARAFSGVTGNSSSVKNFFQGAQRARWVGAAPAPRWRLGARARGGPLPKSQDDRIFGKTTVFLIR